MYNVKILAIVATGIAVACVAVWLHLGYKFVTEPYDRIGLTIPVDEASQ